MYERILIATDGSEAASTAATAAFALASTFDATLSALHVLEDADTSLGEEIVGAVVDAAREVDVETRSTVRPVEGAVHETILTVAREENVDCIVIGTHGEDSLHRFLLGSVATRTLRESPVPVVTVHAETEISRTVDHVLVPTDGSESAMAAAEEAVEFARRTGASLHTIHSVSSEEYDDYDDLYESFETAGERAIQDVIDVARRAGDLTVQGTVVSGSPHRAIDDYVLRKDIDYVFMGTHGRTGVSRYLLGSVTERVVRLVDVPIVSLKAAAPSDQERF